MTPTTAQRIEQLWPPLKVKAYQLLQLLSLKEIDCEVSQGLRTWAEQEALYAQGRNGSPGPIVTNAQPGQSWHTFGMAFDIDIQNGNQLDWDAADPEWQSAIAAGESLGLVAGATWRTFPDRPHFQLTGRFPVTPDAEVLSLYQQGGIAAVWAAADPQTPVDILDPVV